MTSPEPSGNDSGDRAVLFEAWFAHATEWSKSIFTISSAAIGLIVTGIFTAPTAPKAFTLVCLVISAVCFAAATVFCLSAFKVGSAVIKNYLTDAPENAQEGERELGRLKSLQYGFFVWGLLMLLAAALAHSVTVVGQANSSTNSQSSPEKK